MEGVRDGVEGVQNDITGKVGEGDVVSSKRAPTH